MSHDLHRLRRKPIESYFSHQGVTQLQPLLRSLSTKLVSRLQALGGPSTVVRLDHAFTAFSGDVIGKVCCDSYGFGDLLEDEAFSAWLYVRHVVDYRAS